MIGVDLVFIPEFKKQLDIGGERFIGQAFSMSELKNSQVEHLAGLWAAKEAILKADPKAPKKMADIVIAYDGAGKPYTNVGKQRYEISIAHHGDYALAVALRVET